MSKNVLTIDPGQRSGISIVTWGFNPALLFHAAYDFKKQTETPSSLISRLVEAHNVGYAGIEDQYLGKNVDSLKKLSRTSGRWEEACAVQGIEVEFINTKTWESQVLKGLGKVHDQVKKAAEMVAKARSGISLKTDEADAFCIGIYYSTKLADLDRTKYLQEPR